MKTESYKPEIKSAVRRLPTIILLCGALLILSAAQTAFGQLQRTVANPSFETPVIPVTSFRFVNEADTNGWLTTHPVRTGFCDVGDPNCRPIEYWSTGFNSVFTATGAGNQFAEINADAVSMIYQNICLVNNESFSYSYLHRGRDSATVPDVMDFRIGIPTGLPAGSKPSDSYSFPIQESLTTNDGTITVPVNLEPTQGTIDLTPDDAGNGWRRYSGTYNYTGTSQAANIGFVAVSTAGGDVRSGNFIDDWQLILNPIAEFSTTSASIFEGTVVGGGNNTPTNGPFIRVSGTVAAATTITVSVTGGTATIGTDYSLTTPFQSGNTTNSVVISIPAGTYDGVTTGLFAVPFSISADNTSEANETVSFSISTSTGFTISNVTTCGTAGTAANTYTIINDDAPTAATASIAGRLYFNEQPLRNTLVVLYNTVSNTRQTVRTDASGEYAFVGEEVGANYIIQPLSSRFAFSPFTRVFSLLENIGDADFVSAAKIYRPKNDFDGDGKSDIAVYRPSEGNWFVLQSSNNEMSVFKFGTDTDVPVAADYDGDGKTDYAVFRPSEGTWYVWESAAQKLRVDRFGLAADKLVPADYDGDGKIDVAVYRDGVWYVNQSSNGAVKSFQWGTINDVPSAEDFDGDGQADPSVYRPAEGIWYVTKSSTGGSNAFRFGVASDIPVAGDYDGDGVSDIAQFRSGTWYVLNSATGFQAEQFGQENDRSIVGDYDGDGRAETTVFRDGTWFIRNSGSGTLRSVSFGRPTDVLVK